jgi:hypothetical protein
MLDRPAVWGLQRRTTKYAIKYANPSIATDNRRQIGETSRAHIAMKEGISGNYIIALTCFQRILPVRGPVGSPSFLTQIQQLTFPNWSSRNNAIRSEGDSSADIRRPFLPA